MELKKTKNTVRNIGFGFFNNVVQIIFPFIGRTVLLYVLGAQYLGLSSLFTAVLGVLSFAELGFGTTMVFSMYKPIADDNKELIRALLNLYRKIYRVVGVVILTGGILVMPFLRFLIAGSYPADINLYLLFSIYLANSVIGYFCFSYKSSLFVAHQRNDVTSLISIITTTVCYAIQIPLLFCFKNYYIYVAVVPFTTILNNVLISFLSKRRYPEYYCEGGCSKETKKEIKSKLSALVIHRVGYVIQSTIDNLAISSFLGLTMLAIFNNYFYIINAVLGFVAIMFTSMTAGLGNSLIKKDEAANLKIFRKVFYLLSWIISWATICIFVLMQHFMLIWVGSELMLPFALVFLFSFQFYVTSSRYTVGTYKDALGMWKEDQWKPIVISIVNFIGTFASIKFFGFYGVILSTLVSYLFVGFPWETHVFFKRQFKEEKRRYLLSCLINLVVMVVACILTYFICALLPNFGIGTLFLKLLICLVLPNVIFASVYLWQEDVRAVFFKIFKRRRKVNEKKN